jgi:hypothetical protein
MGHTQTKIDSKWNEKMVAANTTNLAYIENIKYIGEGIAWATLLFIY